MENQEIKARPGLLKRMGTALLLGFCAAIGASIGKQTFNALTGKKGELIPIKGGKRDVI